jgi:hypothetical protein
LRLCFASPRKLSVPSSTLRCLLELLCIHVWIGHVEIWGHNRSSGASGSVVIGLLSRTFPCMDQVFSL